MHELSFIEDSGTQWSFDPGCLSLSFAYSGEFAGRREGNEPAEGSGVEAWMRARFAGLETTSSPGTADGDALRDAIVTVANRVIEGSEAGADDIDVLNLYAATPDIPPSLSGGRRQAGGAGVRRSQVLSTVARDAIAIFGTTGRLRECDAADCRLLFYDESRAGSRRWCSMQRCGNRAKVRAYRARQ